MLVGTRFRGSLARSRGTYRYGAVNGQTKKRRAFSSSLHEESDFPDLWWRRMHRFYALSRWERFVGFLLCCLGASICFLVSFLMLPLIALKPRKFVVPFSMGSLLFMLGFAILSGPVAHLKHIFGPERLPFTAAYLGSLAMTLYFALGVSSVPILGKPVIGLS